MNRTSLGLASLLVGTVALGCGGGGGTQKYPDATVDFDAQPDTARPDASVNDTAIDTAGTDPMAGIGSHVLVSGTVVLIGSGADSCTNQVPATGDRWCGFSKPSTTLGFNELWVINATKAAAGVAIKCDTTDANCLRLTSGLYDDPSIGFRIHGFDGETLIYYAELGATATADSGFIGPIYGWRPGWVGGRKLTSDTGVVCSGQAKSATALCFENRDDSVTNQVSYELHAGALPADGLSGLPLVETVLIALSTDDANARKFQADLSPDGTYIAWSARPNATGLETLKVQKVGDVSTRITVATDVTRWVQSADNTTWTWLSKFNYNTTGSEAGALQTATFPNGATPTTLAPSVADFLPAGTKGVVYRANETNGGGDLVYMADTTMPATVKMLDKGVLGVIDQSADGTKSAYVKSVSADGSLTDLYVASATANTPCTLTGQTIAAPISTFVSGGNVTAWARVNQLSNDVEGVYTTTSDCLSRKYASAVFRWLPASDEGYVYLDQTAADVDESTLRYAKVTSGSLPAGTVLQTRAASVFAPLLPTLPAVMYTVGTHTAADGLYINSTLPFTTTPVLLPDGGTTPDATPTDATTTDATTTDATTIDAAADTSAVDAGAETATDAGDPDAPDAG